MNKDTRQNVEMVQKFGIVKYYTLPSSNSDTIKEFRSLTDPLYKTGSMHMLNELDPHTVCACYRLR